MREVMNIPEKRSSRADGGTYAVDREVQALEVVVLLLGDLEQVGSVIDDGASGVLVHVKGIGSEEDEGSACVGDAGCLREDGCVAIPDRLINADVLRRRGRSSERTVPENSGERTHLKSERKTTGYTQSVDIADESGGVGAAEGQETVGRRHVRRGLERNAKGLRADQTLLERVVQDRRDDLPIGDGSRSQPGWTNPNERSG